MGLGVSPPAASRAIGGACAPPRATERSLAIGAIVERLSQSSRGFETTPRRENALTKLGDSFGKSSRAQITLVDRSRNHIWKPLLHAIAAGNLRRSQHKLNYLAQAHWHGFRFRLGELVGLNREDRIISLAALHDEEGAEISPASTLPYDTLVIAVGSITNDFDTPGATTFAVPLETPEQATLHSPPRQRHHQGPMQSGRDSRLERAFRSEARIFCSTASRRRSPVCPPRRLLHLGLKGRA
jgi:hypothetical protein